MYSANMFDVAERNGFYSRSSGQPLDFLPTFGPMRSHSEYSTRRVWSVFRQVAPSLHLPGNTDYYGNDYPFSVKAERVLYPSDMMALLRDHFEGKYYWYDEDDDDDYDGDDDNDTNGDGDYDDTGVDDEDYDDTDHNQWFDTSPSLLPLTGL